MAASDDELNGAPAVQGELQLELPEWATAPELVLPNPLFDEQLARVADAEVGQSDSLPQDLEGRIARAEAALTDLLRRGHPICVSWSAGKDSSVVLNLLLVAAAKLRTAGEDVPPIVVTHADTSVENPEVQLYARNEMAQVRDFARRHKLDVEIEISHPNLSDQWAVRVIGGRALPPFPGTNRDCSWKCRQADF